MIFILVSLAGLPEAVAQYKHEKDATVPLEYFYIKRHKGGIIRPWLTKFYFGLSSGLSHTSFKHELDGFGILQNPGADPVIFNSGGSAGNTYSNWISKVSTTTTAPAAGSFMVDSDTATIGFKSRMISVPLKGTLHYEFNRYRIGGGYSVEYTFAGNFKPTAYGNQINNVPHEVSTFLMKKYFGMIGAMVYRYYEYSVVVDANIGGYKLGKHFDKSVIKKGVYVNIGVSGERQFSEYFTVFVRPSYEFKSYKLSMPESGSSITHKMNAFYLNVGATYRLPELRRCVIKQCKAQINHAHGNREYRSRAHAIYEKQNPKYGENYPVLIKYKGRNKKKLNPY